MIRYVSLDCHTACPRLVLMVIPLGFDACRDCLLGNDRGS